MVRRGAVALMLSLGLAGAAAAQGQALTLQQVERKYPQMSPIHIEKCDKGGDGVYDRGEMACVQSIYNVMYRDR